MHNLNAKIALETNFCRLKIRDLWAEMYGIGKEFGAAYKQHLPIRIARAVKLAETANAEANFREKRHWLFGHWVNN